MGLKTKNQKGFTLVELILFLALSALFLLIALTGIRGRTAEVQFTDSVRSMEVAVEKYINDIFSGVNLLEGTPLSDANDDGSKVLAGLFFETPRNSNVVNVYPIIANRLTKSGYDALSPQEKSDAYRTIYATRPEVVPEGMTTYQLEWGSQILVGGNADAGRLGEIVGFAFIRNPYGQSLHPLAFRASNFSMADILENPGIFNPTGGNRIKIFRTVFSSHLCIVSPESRVADISVAAELPDTNVDAHFGSNTDPRLKGLGCPIP